MAKLSELFRRLRFGSLAVLFIAVQAGAALAPFVYTQKASAINECVVDTAGANDEPNQKDLTQLCLDDSNSPTSINVTWNWDDFGTQGANTLDACALFDSDGDGFVDYSVCVTTEGIPATLKTITTYSCKDARIDRCQNPNTVISSGNTTCVISAQNNDPFPAGGDYPSDIEADCEIDLSTMSAGVSLVDVCSYPSQQPNSDPSDCVIIRDNSSKLELIKHLTPTSDSGLFDLSIDGTKYATDVGHNGTTGEVVVDVGNNGDSIVFLEEAGSNTSLTSYNTAFECRDQNGLGDVIASGEQTGATTRQITVDVDAGTDVVCIVTNTRQQATLTLVKTVVNDDGGTLSQSDFPVQIDGNTAQWGSNTLSPGSYVVTETQQTGYEASSWGGDCDANGNVTLADGENKTCSITNNDIAPELGVTKRVINDNGGDVFADEFKLYVNDVEQTDARKGGGTVEDNSITYLVPSTKAGVSYTLTEDDVDGYTQTSLVCVDTDTQQTVNHPVTLVLGQDVECTITNNDDAPQLTLLKSVVNDNGGDLANTAFTLHLIGGDYTGSEDFITGSTPAVDANTEYTMSEDNIFGYEKTSTGCIDDDSRQAVSHPVTLSPGQNVTCTITNDDIAPKLTVIKVVDNEDYNGQLTAGNFPLFVDGFQVESGVQNDFNADDYIITETQQDGYEFIDYSGDCLSDGTIKLEIGGVYTCTLTNKALPVTITVTKQVTNNNGGTATVSDFELYVNDTEVSSGVANTFPGNVEYTVSEQALVDGYDQTSLICTDQDDNELGDTFTPNNGDVIECVIANDDKAPTLTLIKSVVNDYGDADDANDWTLSATPDFNLVGATTVSGDGNPNDGNGVGSETVFANVKYTLSEDEPHEGYLASGWVCSRDISGGNEITFSLGENVTCTITNRAVAPQITVIKNVVNDNGGDQDAEDFTMQVEATNPSQESFPGSEAGVVVNVDEGEYEVSEIEQAGYTASYSEGCVGNISIGETRTCTITNDDQPGSITVIKNIDTDGDNEADQQDVDSWLWNIGETGPFTTGSENPQTVDAGTYVVSEQQQDGYTVISVSCGEQSEPVQATSVEVNVANGEDIVCIFLNQAEPVLNLAKTNDSLDPVDNGDTVTYTLTVSLPDDSGALFDTTVIDLPPEGFTYVPGSWTASSSVRGDIKDTITTEPTYASPGTWVVGSMVPGEIVTLTYQALVGDSVTPGTYPDVAFASGCGTDFEECSDENIVYSNLSTEDDPFVGTEVSLAGRVLGVSDTVVLVNTGMPMLWAVMFTSALMLAGGVMASRVKTTSKGGRR